MRNDVTVDMFLVTYPRDYYWLPYLWRSVELYGGGRFRRCVVVVEDGDPEPSVPSFAEVVRCRQYRGTPICGYSGQAVECLRAHLYTDADVIWFAEADTPLIRSVADYPFDRPLMIRMPWDRLGVRMCSPCARDWKPRTEALLDMESPAHTTVWPPFVYPRCVLERAWDIIGGEDPLFDYLDGGPWISQHDILGTVAMQIMPEVVEIVDAEAYVDAGRPWWVKHFANCRDVESPDVQAQLRELGLT